MGVCGVYQGANNMRMGMPMIQCGYRDLWNGNAQWMGKRSVCDWAMEMRTGT